MPLAEVEHPVLYSDVGTKDEFFYFIIELGEEFYQQWLAAIKEVKLAQLTEEEKQLVLSYSADIKGEKSYEGDTRPFGQIWFNAPFMRATELQAMAGGKTYAFSSGSSPPSP